MVKDHFYLFVLMLKKLKNMMINELGKIKINLGISEKYLTIASTG